MSSLRKAWDVFSIFVLCVPFTNWSISCWYIMILFEENKSKLSFNSVFIKVLTIVVFHHMGLTLPSPTSHLMCQQEVKHVKLDMPCFTSTLKGKCVCPDKNSPALALYSRATTLSSVLQSHLKISNNTATGFVGHIRSWATMSHNRNYIMMAFHELSWSKCKCLQPFLVRFPNIQRWS